MSKRSSTERMEISRYRRSRKVHHALAIMRGGSVVHFQVVARRYPKDARNGDLIRIGNDIRTAMSRFNAIQHQAPEAQVAE